MTHSLPSALTGSPRVLPVCPRSSPPVVPSFDADVFGGDVVDEQAVDDGALGAQGRDAFLPVGDGEAGQSREAAGELDGAALLDAFAMTGVAGAAERDGRVAAGCEGELSDVGAVGHADLVVDGWRGGRDGCQLLPRVDRAGGQGGGAPTTSGARMPSGEIADGLPSAKLRSRHWRCIRKWSFHFGSALREMCGTSQQNCGAIVKLPCIWCSSHRTEMPHISASELRVCPAYGTASGRDVDQPNGGIDAPLSRESVNAPRVSAFAEASLDWLPLLSLGGSSTCPNADIRPGGASSTADTVVEPAAGWECRALGRPGPTRVRFMSAEQG